MDVGKLPFDNIFKFMAIGGLALFIACMIVSAQLDTKMSQPVFDTNHALLDAINARDEFLYKYEPAMKNVLGLDAVEGRCRQTAKARILCDAR